MYGLSWEGASILLLAGSLVRRSGWGTGWNVDEYEYFGHQQFGNLPRCAYIIGFCVSVLMKIYDPN